MSRPRVQSLIKLTYWTFSVGSYTGTFSIGGEGYFLFLHIIVVIHVSQYRSFAVMGVPVCRKQNAD